MTVASSQNLSTPPEDPLDLLNWQAKRLRAEKAAKDATDAVQVRLLVGRAARAPFFASLAYRLRWGPEWAIPTAATDGERLIYNPAYVEGLPKDQAMGLVVHEVMHNALYHFDRLPEKRFPDRGRAQIAYDLEINGMVREAGYVLPPGGVYAGEGQFRDLPPGKTCEQYYPMLPESKKGEGGDGDGPPGTVQRPPGRSPAQRKALRQKVANDIVQAAEAAKGRGELPGGLQRLVDSIVRPKRDPRDVLEQYVSRWARNDYDWRQPNPKYVGYDIYIPDMRSQELGDAALFFDTSGSVSVQMMRQLAGWCQSMFEVFKCRLTILYHDTKVAGVQVWEPTDGDLRLRPAGGGGTDHRPVFRHVKEHMDPPTVCVVLSDMQTCWPDKHPGYPVILARVGKGGTIPHWADHLIDLDD